MRILPADDAARATALEELRQGRLILFPTETVYGVGADAANLAAVELLAVAKGRPPGKPFQWLVAEAGMARLGSTGWDDRAERLARAFWPGPLTLVVPSGEGTIGWRVPAHGWLLGLLREFGRAILASSANFSDRPPPKSCAEAVRLMGASAGLAVDGGAIPPGEASTVAQLTPNELRILRPGAIPESALLRALS